MLSTNARGFFIIFFFFYWIAPFGASFSTTTIQVERRPGDRLVSWQRFNSRHNSDTGNGDVDNIEGGDTFLLQAEFRSMKVKDLKEALSTLNLSTTDVFEKEELVQRLLKARRKGGKQRQDVPPTPSSVPYQPARDDTVIVAPLYFTHMDTNVRVAAANMNGGGIQVNPSDHPYPTVEFEVVTPGSGGSSSSSSTFTLRLLVDTACSGFVLRPSVVEQYHLPRMSTSVTMTGAGGTVGATGLTQLSQFSIGGTSFGPLPAAVQEIGALPSALDGIVGLSFLHMFAAVDMDFFNGKLFLHKKRGAPIPEVSLEQGTLVARGTMDMIPQYGIYTVETMLGSRGPVKMLVDSGAASTFLSWDGVSNLGLSRSDTSFLQPLSSPMGLMGSDNIAMQLTHTLAVSSMIHLGGQPRTTTPNLRGLSLAGTKRLRIDIGDIAILENMKHHKVGGILGIDALMRASCVRLVLEGSKKEILLFER